MGLKWQVDANSIDELEYRIDIYEEGYSSNVIDLTGQMNLVSFSVEGEQVSLDTTFRTRSPEVRVYDPNETLASTYRAADRTHRVEIFRKQVSDPSFPSDPLWLGYLLSDFYEYEPKTVNVPTTLRLTEGLGTLKGKAFDPSGYSGTPQEADIRQFIADGLSELEYSLPINIAQTWYPGVLSTRWGNGDQPLEYLRVLTDNWQEDRTALADESYISWYDVLRACLSAFDLTLLQSDGEWWATQRPELVGGTVQRWQYNADGTLASSDTPDITFDLSAVSTGDDQGSFWTQRSDTHRTHDFDAGVLDQLVKTSSFELQFSDSDNAWNVRRSGEVRRQGYPLADKEADVNGTDSYHAELDGIEETEWQTPWQISQQLPIDIRGEGNAESVVSLDSWLSSGGSYREMRMELWTGEGFYLTEKYNELQHTGTWEQDRNHIQINEVQGSADGQIMVPEGTTLKLVRGPSSFNALLATIDLEEPLRVGDTRVVGQLSGDLDFTGDSHYLFWAAWESSQGMVTLPTTGSQWLEYTLVSRLRTPNGVRVEGVPTLRFYTQDDGASGNRQPGYLDHVRVGLLQDGDSIGVVTGSASLTQAGETDTTGHRVGQGPTEDAIARLRAEDDTNTVWDAPDNWTSDATGESQDTLKMLHAAETLRTRRNHLERRKVQTYPRAPSEVPHPHEVIQYEGSEWTVHRYQYEPGEGRLDLLLIELREDGNADITTQLTYGESEDDDTASSAPTASVGSSGGGASSWDELTGKPSGILAQGGDSDGISETVTGRDSDIIAENIIRAEPTGASPNRYAVSNTSSPETEIQSAIDYAANNGGGPVVLGSAVVEGGYDVSQVSFDNSVVMEVAGQRDSGFNVRAYGAAGDGSTDDSSAAQAAVNAAGAQSDGSTLVFPGPAVYPIEFVDVNDPGVSLKGMGWHCVVRGPGAGSGAFTWAPGNAEEVTIENLALDVNSAQDFDAVLRFEDSDGPVRIQNCKIFDSNKASQGDWTINAITALGVDNITVKHCFGDGVQFKLAGGSLSSQDIQAVGNILYDATNFGITAVVSDNATLENVLFDNNTVRGYNRGGLYAGRDGSGSTGVTTDKIKITNNTSIAGSNVQRTPAFGILVRGGDASKGRPKISGNDCVGASVSGDIWGIDVRLYDEVDVTNNTLFGPFTPGSIGVRDIPNARVVGNSVFATADGRVRFDRAGGVVRDNTLDGQGAQSPHLAIPDANGATVEGNRFVDFDNDSFSGAIVADSSTGAETDATIRDNEFIDNAGNFQTAIRYLEDGSADIQVRGNDAANVGQFFSNSTVKSSLWIGPNRGLSPDIQWLLKPTESVAFAVRDTTNSDDLARLLESGKLEVAKVGAGTVTDPSASVQTDQDLLIQDSSIDPAVNGEFRQNTGDVKVFSGGAVRNLSEIRAEDRWVRLSQETATGYPETAAMVINTNKQRSAWDSSDQGIVHMRASLTNYEPEAGRNNVHMWVNFRGDEITYQASAQIDVRLAENGSGESVIVLQDTSTDQQRTTVALDMHVGHNTVADTLRDITIGTETDLSTYTILSSPSQQYLYEDVAPPDDTLQGTYQLEGRLSLPRARTRQSYAPGFTGSGWAIGDNLQKPDAAQLSHLTVRGTLRAFEFLVEQTRVRTGPQAVSPGGGKLETVSLRTHSSRPNTFEQWDITAVDTGGGWVEVDNSTGDTNPLNDLSAGQYVLIDGSTGNDENYTVNSLSDQGSGITRVTFNESLPDATADGVLMEAVRQDWTFENDGGSGMGHGFVNEDRVLAQRFDPDSQTVIAQVRAVVDGADSRTDASVTVDTDFFVPPTGKDTDGFEFFVVGSPRDHRDSIIYDNPFDPSREYLDGISDFDVWDNRADQIRTKVGNLDTRYDYTSETYGMAAGDPTDVWISADDTKGVRMVDNTQGANTVRAQLQGSALTLGDTADPHVKIDPTDRGLQMINTQGTEAARLDGTALRLGEEQNEHILIDPAQNGVQMINANGTEVGRFSGSLLQLGSSGQIVFDPSQSPEAQIVGTLQMGDGSGNGKIINANTNYRIDEDGVALDTPFDRVESSSITFFENLGGTEDDVGSLHAESGDQEVVIDTFDLHTDYNIRFSANDYVDVEGVQFLNGALYFINPRPSDIEPGDIPAGTAVLYAREYSDGNINLKWAENQAGGGGSKDEIF